MYFSTELDTLDGETMFVVYPTKLKEWTRIIDGEEPMIRDYFKINYDGRDREVMPYTIHKTEYESVKSLLYQLKKSINWMSDDNNAPPKNPKIYIKKSKEGIKQLTLKYADDYPELFV